MRMRQDEKIPVRGEPIPGEPVHVAIIMDGNRRWAKAHHLKEINGHLRAVARIKEIVKVAAKKGIGYLTFWAFSTENWKRNKTFLKDIFWLFRHVLNQKRGFFKELVGFGGQIHILGDLNKFPADIVKKINDYLKIPLPRKTIDINFALNYGGRDDLVRAFKKIVAKGYPPSQITTNLISNHLDTAGQPDVDLLIRTGGEIRTSGFLAWQLNYAEFYFTKTYFPDFGEKEFLAALKDYAGRQRRFGGDHQN